MKLTCETITVKDVIFGDQTIFNDGVLTINKNDILDMISSEVVFKNIEVQIVRPDENARIVNIVDYLEPSCKISGGTDWPGVIGEYQIAGNGTTRRLKGVCVTMCNTNKNWDRRRLAILEMQGFEKFSPMGKFFHIVITPESLDDTVSLTDYAEALRRIGCKIGVMMARATLHVEAESIEVFDNTEINPNLPNVAYYYQVYSKQYDAGGCREKMFYGNDIGDTLPLLVQPTEIIDGAISAVGTYRAMETFSIQNHPIIYELLRRHGKDLNFVGVIIGVVSVEATRRRLAAAMVANMMKEVLHADGAVFTKNMGGAGNIDMSAAASECEKLGIKTTLLVQILNADSNLATEVLFDDRRLDALVQCGVYFEKLFLPPIEKIYGGSKTDRIAHDNKIQFAADEVETIPLRYPLTVNHLGISDIVAVEY